MKQGRPRVFLLHSLFSFGVRGRCLPFSWPLWVYGGASFNVSKKASPSYSFMFRRRQANRRNNINPVSKSFGATP
jgi:hypothetical protein